LDEQDFNHPCKGVCSGWKQGYEKGLGDYVAEISDLENFIKKQQLECQQLQMKLNKAIEVLEYVSNGMSKNKYGWSAKAVLG
jgi:hypothetical protein